MRERAVGLRLRAGWRFACFLSCRVALSLALVRYCLACGSGFHFPGSPCFPCLSSGLVRLRRAPSSLRFPRVLPVPCVSCCVLAFCSRLIRRVLSARRSCSVARPRLDNSVRGACRPIGAVPCFAPSASVCRLSSSLRLVLSARLGLCSRSAVPRSALSRRPSPRSSICSLRPSRYRSGSVSVLPRSAPRPALLVGWRGGLEFRSSLSLVPRWLVVSLRAPSSLLVFPSRYRAWRCDCRWM